MGSLRFQCCSQTTSETTTHRHVRSCSAGFSEKRPQKAWLSPPVIAHQNNSTRCSLRSTQIFRQFFGYAAAWSSVESDPSHQTFGQKVDDHLELTLASCVSLACSSHNNGFETGGYSPVQWAFGADNDEHGFTTTMPSEIETFWTSAMNRYLQEQARDAISRVQHTTRKENFDLAPGTWVMYFRRGKVTRGAIGAPSKSGLWLGPARVIMTEAVQQWSGSILVVHSFCDFVRFSVFLSREGISHCSSQLRTCLADR